MRSSAQQSAALRLTTLLVLALIAGDMQLSKRELAETQMIVTTPEKWDVITRKGGDVAVASLVKLLIIDEVHLLNDERGPVIETLIARTLRQVRFEHGCLRSAAVAAAVMPCRATVHGSSDIDALCCLDNLDIWVAMTKLVFVLVWMCMLYAPGC